MKYAMPDEYAIVTLDTKNIRQLTIDDFNQLYEIWEAGTPVAISNPRFDVSEKGTFYKAFFKNALLNQTEAFAQEQIA